MNRVIFLAFLVVLSTLTAVFTGCEQANISDNELFVVELKKGKPLVYKMISERNILVDFDPAGELPKKKKDTKWTMYERLEIGAKLELVKIDSKGLMNIKISYPEVRINRKGRGRTKKNDAILALKGKAVELTMTPAGLITDYSKLEELLKSLADGAFSEHKAGPIKDQDMVTDFFALQWFMFDAIGSIEDPVEGLKAGQSWKSTLPVPAPMLLHTARDTTYTLNQITEEDRAIIDSTYTMIKEPESFPNIYSGRSYRQRGFFGVLRCKPISLEGKGQIIYDLKNGILEKDSQQYKLTTTAVLFMPLPGTEGSKMEIDQKLSIELIR